MTETELAAIVRTIAPLMREYVTKAIGDLTPRLAAAEATLATLGDVRDRVIATETKAGLPNDVAKDLAALRERVAVLEVKPVQPGPPGEQGPAGKDGAPGLTYEGVYQDGQTYEKGMLVTWAGATWHCNESTATKPGETAKAWTLMVKRGRDGKDGRDAPAPLPVVAVR